MTRPPDSPMPETPEVRKARSDIARTLWAEVQAEVARGSTDAALDRYAHALLAAHRDALAREVEELPVLTQILVDPDGESNEQEPAISLRGVLALLRPQKGETT